MVFGMVWVFILYFHTIPSYHTMLYHMPYSSGCRYTFMGINLIHMTDDAPVDKLGLNGQL